MHLAGPLDGLDESSGAGGCSIGGVIVSRRDRSLCVEDLRHILVEVHAVAVQGSALREGQGRVATGSRGSHNSVRSTFRLSSVSWAAICKYPRYRYRSWLATVPFWGTFFMCLLPM
ncbi:hypothetical protein [Akkermansia sp.]|uniref:hypothetical protein n=1 Tax=Akkermansia sp. TaxID=1872421 RepID=UPI00258FA707|nr:hypothetical protein [Akkermansia sp.]MCC8092857.1 hypothetical protein [Akkermansia sp.]